VNLDKFQQAWQSQSSRTQVTIDSDLLLKEVQRSQQNLRAVILVRDFREIAVALLMLPIWFYMGYRLSLPWTWYLTVPAIIWVAGFLVVDCVRHSQKFATSDVPLLQCVQDSLAQVNHQIWLLRNVFWWYLLPFTVSILTFFTQIAWRTSRGWQDVLAHSCLFTFVIALYYFIDYINQYAVSKDLEPRRQELLELRASLSDELSDDLGNVSSTPAPKVLRRWLIIALLALAILTVIALTK
jgi:hypothetical protein